MVSVSVYPFARSSRVTVVGPVGRFVVLSHPAYVRTSWVASLYTA
ncbi:hypothetical protein R5W24_006326 [Gemmata sp. JC717]|nr:hypothetical protein [Gemmata algarum]MDY3557139.1 hypothetical protein [Gemmata algarum]